MDPKETRQKAIRDTKKCLILDAARSVFSEQGFHNTNIEHIAHEAGFSKPSLYNYYRDKEDIFLHLALREIDRLLEKIDANRNESNTVLENIEGMVRAVFDTFGEHFYFLLTISHFPLVTLCHEEKGQQLYFEFTTRMQLLLQKFTQVISEGRTRGEIASEADDTNIARYITGMIKSVFVHWRFAEKKGDAEKEIASIMAFIAKGVSANEES